MRPYRVGRTTKTHRVLACGLPARTLASPQMLTTVLRTGAVLALFDSAHPERSVTEVARELALPRSTVHALLSALCAAGLLRKTPARRYALGWQFPVLAGWLAATEPALAVACKAAEELAGTWGGAARVVVRDPAWGPVELLRAGGKGSAHAPSHRCQAARQALAAGEAAFGCDLEVTRPGWCCLAAVVRGTGGALAVDLTVPAPRFYAHAGRVRASLLSACGYRTAWVVPVAAGQTSRAQGSR